MLLNHLRIAIRNIKKDRIFSVINIAGLAVGIACFLILYLFVHDELSFDTYNKDADKIYRIFVKSKVGNEVSCNSKTPGLLGQTLVHDYPEVSSFTRIGYFGQRDFKFLDKSIRAYSIYWVDSTFFDFFTLQFIYGSPETALTRPNNIVLTASIAKKFFGSANPVGRVLRVTNRANEDYIITGVVKDFPRNSHFSCEYLASIITNPIINDDNWIELWYSTYIKLKQGTDAKAFEKKLENTVRKYVGPKVESALGVSVDEFLAKGNDYRYFIQPLSSIYLRSQRDYGIDLNTEWSDIRQSDIAYTYVFSSVAVFILLIALINFMNLSTARSERRAKEVGIRKTLGSDRFSLVKQFITESILTSTISFLFSIVLLEIILPMFNSLTGKKLQLDLFSNYYSLPILVCFVLIVGILAGSYPAFYLSSFQPVQVLKVASGKKNRKSILRSVLVIIQFSISICLLIGTLIIKQQIDYVRNKNLGLNKEQLIQLGNAFVMGSHSEAFKELLLKNSAVKSVSYSSEMFVSGIPGSGYFFDKKASADPVSMQFLETDYDFLKTYQIRMADGRFFSREYPSDSEAVIINEAALKAFGGKDVIGKDLNKIKTIQAAKSYKIIGVVKDFNYESLHQKIRPLEIHLLPRDQKAQVFTIKISTTDMKKTIEYIKSSWCKFQTGADFNYDLVDQNLERLYESEKVTGLISAIFSFLAIFIACLGLFGLAAFVTEQRTKEIGIRKVLGASIFEIIALLSKEFTWWVILANLIAWRVAFLIMRKWLENFAYRIEINYWIFIISGFAALIIALATVSLHTLRVATANPVKSLKYE